VGDGARAVGDGEGGGLGDGVGLAVVHESGRLRAVGGQSSDDLCNVGGLSRGGGSKARDSDG
jgi:hypothetical protein